MVRRGQRNRIRWENIESPCVKICKLENGVCIGCGRTQDEILLARQAEKKAALKKEFKKQKDFLNHKLGD